MKQIGVSGGIFVEIVAPPIVHSQSRLLSAANRKYIGVVIRVELDEQADLLEIVQT